MAVYKQFNTNEVVITPFHANKGFQFTGPQVTASDVGIEYYQSIQGPYTTGSNPTGFTTRLDGVLVFNNIKQLYYSNYLTSSTGDNFPTRSLIPGLTPEYDDYVGVTTGPRFDNFLQSSVQQDRRFSQFSSTTNEKGPSVISIPSNLFGEKISPSTFNFTYTSSVPTSGAGGRLENFIYDDGEGNLIVTQSLSRAGIPTAPISSGSIGQIFYSQGIAIITDGIDIPDFAYNVGSEAGVGNRNLDSASIAFSSSILIIENQYKCTVRDSEYSYTLNPSILRPTGELSTVTNQLSSSIISTTPTPPTNDWNPGVYLLSLTNTSPSDLGVNGTVNVTVASDSSISDITIDNPGRGYVAYDKVVLITTGMGGTTSIITITLQPNDIVFPSNPTNKDQVYQDFATGSDFSPYVTTIGLYNNEYQLVAVGKLAQPIPISLYTDTTFVVNIDT